MRNKVKKNLRNNSNEWIQLIEKNNGWKKEQVIIIETKLHI